MITSDLTYLPISGDGFWSIDFTHVQFEGYNKISNPSSATKATLDTGTSLTYFIPTVYDKVLSNFLKIDSSCADQSGLVVCDCPTGDLSGFPNLYF